MLLFAALALFATELSAELSAESAAAELSAEGRKRLAPWGAPLAPRGAPAAAALADNATLERICAAHLLGAGGHVRERLLKPWRGPLEDSRSWS